LNKLKNNKI